MPEPGDIARIVFQAFGLFYAIGGLYGLRLAWTLSRIDAMTGQIERMTAEHAGGLPPVGLDGDRGRSRWMIAGLIVTIAAGVAMALASRWSVPLLAALVAHQLLYFLRQRRVELKARTEEEAEHARPARSTRNAAFVAMVLAVHAAVLYAAGELA